MEDRLHLTDIKKRKLYPMQFNLCFLYYKTYANNMPKRGGNRDRLHFREQLFGLIFCMLIHLMVQMRHDMFFLDSQEKKTLC